jgi:DNA polymerase I
MMKYLLIDANYLCFRSMIVQKGLSHEDKSTGVIFGFLYQIMTLGKLFEYPRFIFCWDSEKHPSYREMIYPEYKKKAHKDDPEMIELLQIGKPQFRELRTNILPKIGFKNNFIQTALEADDIIAILATSIHYTNQVGKILQDGVPLSNITIVSSDGDLLQCLSKDVDIYSPHSKKMITKESFMKEYGIEPSDWKYVKAMAGCDSDNVKGVKGVGEITAIKFIKDALKGSSSAFQSIAKESKLIKFNEQLVFLPHEKTVVPQIVEDKFDLREFENICLDLGMRSFLKQEAWQQWKRILR